MKSKTNINAVYRNPDMLWDSYIELFNGEFPLKKSIVEKETLKKSIGNNTLAKSILKWRPNKDIKGMIKSMVSAIKH